MHVVYPYHAADFGKDRRRHLRVYVRQYLYLICISLDECPVAPSPEKPNGLPVTLVYQ